MGTITKGSTPRPQVDDLKIALNDPEPTSLHVESVTPPIVEEHLPRGVVETEIERKEHWFIGSIDQGTTSSRFLIFNGEGTPVASHQIEFENMYPYSG